MLCQLYSVDDSCHGQRVLKESSSQLQPQISQAKNKSQYSVTCALGHCFASGTVSRHDRPKRPLSSRASLLACKPPLAKKLLPDCGEANRARERLPCRVPAGHEGNTRQDTGGCITEAVALPSYRTICSSVSLAFHLENYPSTAMNGRVRGSQHYHSVRGIFRDESGVAPVGEPDSCRARRIALLPAYLARFINCGKGGLRCEQVRFQPRST